MEKIQVKKKLLYHIAIYMQTVMKIDEILLWCRLRITLVVICFPTPLELSAGCFLSVEIIRGDGILYVGNHMEMKKQLLKWQA